MEMGAPGDLNSDPTEAMETDAPIEPTPAGADSAPMEIDVPLTCTCAPKEPAPTTVEGELTPNLELTPPKAEPAL